MLHRTDDGLTTAVGWRVVVVVDVAGWDSWDGRTLEISRACCCEGRRDGGKEESVLRSMQKLQLQCAVTIAFPWEEGEGGTG